ncbi:MAG TPA: hypothetical protein VFI91_11765 [Longimicrobiaceae bacterium]|nr:hypothetical protein [Longimicrobiaceae bacterium]
MLFAASSGAAQQTAPLIGPRVGAGFVVNAPQMFFGANAFALSSLWGGLGIYVDAKFERESVKDEAGFIMDMTVQEADQTGDRFQRDDEVWQSFNLALIRPITPELMLYLGAGMAERESFSQYYDTTRQRGASGYYWVTDEANSGNKVNVMGGGMFRIGSDVFLQFGLESAAPGATVGALISIPLRGGL